HRRRHTPGGDRVSSLGPRQRSTPRTLLLFVEDSGQCPPGVTTPCSKANPAACVRSRRSSFVNIRDACVLTVVSLRNRVSAILVLLAPLASWTRISYSRSVNREGRCVGTAEPGLAKRAITRRVTVGDNRASPRAATRTASTSSSGAEFFSRKPLAPAFRASKR